MLIMHCDPTGHSLASDSELACQRRSPLLVLRDPCLLLLLPIPLWLCPLSRHASLRCSRLRCGVGLSVARQRAQQRTRYASASVGADFGRNH